MRYRYALAPLSSLRSLLAWGLRARLAEGYRAADLRADAMAGLVVGVVALPLSMALAIASGVPPQHGLYTAIIAGVTCALLGGTRFQITGPTAAFVVLLVPVVTRFGLGGLLLAGLMSGLIQVGMGLARMGRLMTFIPHPVTTGFTAGIAVVIATIQLVDLLGLEVGGSPESFVDRVRLMWEARGSLQVGELLVGAFTLAVLIGFPRLTRRVPAPLVALTAAAALVAILGQVVDGFEVATIGSRFAGGIPQEPPMPIVPWQVPGAGGAPMALDFETVQALLPSAFAIAMLGSIESLLAAVVGDTMSGTSHNPNAELIALGVGNILCPFFGGIPATGALARTATNIKAGARSPLSAVVHALFVLACTVALAPLVAYLPMAAMAALLLMVAKNMSEARHFAHLVRVAPKSDTVVLLTCFGLTVLFDMVIAVSFGVVLAALLFMRRMAEITDTRLEEPASLRGLDLPPGIRVYEIAGPLFFGAAQKAVGVVERVDGQSGTVILDMAKVPAMDATGLVALETMMARLRRARHKVVLAGVNPQPAEVLARAGIRREPGTLAFAPDVDTALSMAIVHAARA
ncbi:MAG TPA: C4-dicarboxylic acid transporter DauA [Kofleriaceae bacterium]|nr:C4-dicarboxylic acid transporter DauA [Kofleriaceae bacterium]